MSKDRTGAAALVLLATALVMAACGGRLPARRYYLLAAERPARGPASTAAWVGVQSFRVDPPYDQDRLVYRLGRDAVQVNYYPFDRWAVPLARMLPELVVGAISSSPGAFQIETVRPGRPYDAHLEGRLMVLEEIDTTEGEVIHAVLELTLKEPGGAVLWSRVLRDESLLLAGNVGQVVQEMQEMLQRMVAAAVPDLGATLPR